MAAKRAPHPYSMLNETDWIPTEVDQTTELYELLAEHFGHRTAAGMLGWFVAKRAGLTDPTGAPTRSRFRRNLRELEEMGITPPKPGNGQRTSEDMAVLEAIAQGPVGAKVAGLVARRREYARAQATAAGCFLPTDHVAAASDQRAIAA